MPKNHLSDPDIRHRARSRTILFLRRAPVVALGALLFGVISDTALADPDLELCKQQIFQTTDVNSDGVLSQKEAAADPLNLNRQFFDLVDANRDSVLDRVEYDDLGLFVTCDLCPGVPGCPAS